MSRQLRAVSFEQFSCSSSGLFGAVSGTFERVFNQTAFWQPALFKLSSPHGHHMHSFWPLSRLSIWSVRLMM
eukprot:10391192-Alexandrium_andersonii.AAC.1